MKKIFRFQHFFILPVILAAVFVFAKIALKTNDFKQAEDFPRNALIYVQVQDLPAFIKLWKESEIGKKYLESTNFAEFQRQHLALKLAERADEIDEAVGFFPDLNFLSNLSENKAAAAVYDIGKMEFVFIAPMSEEKILLTNLFQTKSNFDEINLSDETVVYSKEIEVDRNRQRQKIFFANFRGRFVLATNEKYFLQTLDNIRGKTRNNRLSDEPDFQQLTKKMKPNLGTVWLDQKKLNDDWYFKHYWLMSDIDNLKNLRSGMFDFEIQQEKLVEKRVFLMAKSQFTDKIKTQNANRISRLIPENVPYYSIQTVEKNNISKLVSSTFFDTENGFQADKNVQSKEVYYFNDWEKSYGYFYLDSDFDSQIDEIEESYEVNDLSEKTTDTININLSKIIDQANPTVSLKMSSPQSLPSPLFFENRQALVFSLQNPSKFNRQEFEKTISKMAENLFAVNNSNTNFDWKDFAVGEFSARQMPLPSLGWAIFYAFKQNELIFSNNEDLLKDTLSANENRTKFDKTFDKLTVIRLNSRQQVFDDVFKTLQIADSQTDNISANDFFTGNIGSLLNVASDVERIEIKQNSEQNFLFEEIAFVLKEKPE